MLKNDDSSGLTKEKTIDLICFQSVALDVLEILVRGSQASPSPSSPSQPKPQQALSDLLMNPAFLSAVRCTLSSDDNSVMQVSNAKLLKRTCLVFGVG